MKKPTEFVCTLDLDGQHRSVVFHGDSATFETDGIELRATEVPGVFSALIDGYEVPIYLRSDGVSRITVSMRGYSYDATVLRIEHQALFDMISSSHAAQHRTTRITAPMPGMLKSILVKDGASVQKGATLFTLEAMKMENAIKTPMNGIVRSITATPGQTCDKGVQLCVIEPA